MRPCPTAIAPLQPRKLINSCYPFSEALHWTVRQFYTAFDKFG
jgi:hypothetical protein